MEKRAVFWEARNRNCVTVQMSTNTTRKYQQRDSINCIVFCAKGEAGQDGRQTNSGTKSSLYPLIGKEEQAFVFCQMRSRNVLCPCSLISLFVDVVNYYEADGKKKVRWLFVAVLGRSNCPQGRHNTPSEALKSWQYFRTNVKPSNTFQLHITCLLF